MFKYILKMLILFGAMVLVGLALVGSFLAGGYYGSLFALIGIVSVFLIGILVMEEGDRK